MPRRDATQAEIKAFLHELGRRFKGTGALYLAGGSMLVYQGYRPRTVDVDYRFEATSGDDGLFVRALRETQRIIDVLALCRTGVLTVEQIAVGFDEIAPRIELEDLPRIREDDFRRKVEAFVARAQLRSDD